MDRLIPNALLSRAAEMPGRPALRARGIELTYAEAARLATAFAARLAARGMGAGDRVAVVAPSSLAYALALHATLLRGGTLVAIHPALPPAAVEPLLARAAPRIVFDAPGLEAALADAFATGSPADGSAIRPAAPADAPATILFTSGTTGTPRAAVLTHGNHDASAAASAARLGTGARDAWLGCLPLCHVGGLTMLFRAARDGSAVEIHERFDPDAAARSLAGGRVTCASLVARTLERTLDAAGSAGLAFGPGIRAVLVGGGPAPAPLIDRARAAGLPALRTYGLTEAASQVATERPQDAAAGGTESCGPPLDGVEVRIDAPAEGEILVRGPTVMRGYDGEPAIAPGGWLRTGDIGRWTEAGGERRLVVLDRRSDLIVTGGENVYPARVEAALAAHPGVEEVCVVGLPDPWFGRRVAAVLRLRTGTEAADVERHARALLATHEVPRAWRIAGAPLPRTPAGKLARARIREESI